MLRKKENKLKQEKGKENLYFKILIVLVFLFQNQVFSQEDKLIQIEEKIFHTTYLNEDSEKRVQRLEKFFFGTVFPNEDIQKRISKLSLVFLPTKNNSENIKEVPVQAIENPLKENLKKEIPAQVIKNPLKENLKEELYILDRRTGFLINKETKQLLRDNFGNPLSVYRQQNPNLFNDDNSIYPNPYNSVYPNLKLPSPNKPSIPPEILLQLQQGGFGEE